MSNESDNSPPEEPRTIFSPSISFTAASTGPGETPAVASESEAVAPPPPPASAPPAAPPPLVTQFGVAATGESRPIQVGDVLNHIFQVTRFLARGGMGEVFEGINVNSEERVAIKGILPHLAADPAVQAMFRKEARTLTRLSHPALVQYRVLAQEPALGVFYIVTEYIDGKNLSNILGEIHPGAAELRMLTTRLAEGLAAAHALGAIHRDISPDNILLEEGRLDRAKVIDFGIAKDLDASTGTIIGDGFAGKLNYVAPEQLGDFNREVGPWTDVYSLGLTMLAVARGRDVDMGATLVDAVDKRRACPDLSPVPEEIRPIFEKMLQPNPVNRARSMEEVLQMFGAPNRASGGTSYGGALPQTSSQMGAASPQKTPQIEDGAGVLGKFGKSQMMMAAAALVLVLAGGGYWLFGESSPKPELATVAAVATAPPAMMAREILTGGLANVPCAWLDVVNIEENGDAISAAFRGVAGNPAQIQGSLGKLLAAKGVRVNTLDFNDVSPIDANECGPLEAFRKIRALGVEHLSVPQRSFQLVKLGPDAGEDAGKMGAMTPLTIDLNGLNEEVALVGLEPSGTMTAFVTSRRDITDSPGIEKPRPGQYRIPLSTTHNGWSGILMLTGKGPFDAQLLTGPAGSHSGDWADRFSKLAQEGGWKAEMVWYRLAS